MKNNDDKEPLELGLVIKPNKACKRQRVKWETLRITFVSLLLSMSTAVSLINVVIPLGITAINVGFTLKYFIIAISFQVVGLYWGMIIGLLDALLQFVIYGMSPLFRFTSGIGLVIWVTLFWLFFKIIFKVYETESKNGKIIRIIGASFLVWLIAPFTSTCLSLINTYFEYRESWENYKFIAFLQSYLAFMIFDLFAIIIFALTTTRIQLIAAKYQHLL